MSDPKVCIGVHGRYHAFQLAAGLWKEGCLEELLTSYPRFIASRFVPTAVPMKTHGRLEFWRRLHGKLPLIPPPDPGISIAFGKFLARNLPANANILTGWSSATLEAIAPARERGMKVTLERGSCHIDFQTDVLTEEYARWGLPFTATPPEMIERERAEYEQVDKISVPTAYAAKTFIDQGVAPDKMMINPMGVNFRGYDRPEDRGDFSVLFVGQAGLRKGIPRLLKAFAAISDHATLDIVGPLEPGLDQVIAGLPTQNVVFHGALPKDRLPALYANADVFCLPSVEEGFGMVLLEALASGLPVIATDVSAGADLIEDGVTGLTIPPGDDMALENALKAALDHPWTVSEDKIDRLQEDWSWDAYVQRALGMYRDLLS